jgi:hypothetical protein
LRKRSEKLTKGGKSKDGRKPCSIRPALIFNGIDRHLNADDQIRAPLLPKNQQHERYSCKRVINTKTVRV